MKKHDIYRHFGTRIKELRKLKSLTQADLAELIGKTEDTVSNIERGFAGTGLDTIMSLAESLDVHVSELFTSPDKTRKKTNTSAPLMEQLIALAGQLDEHTLSILIQHCDALAKR
jgi:transcriptional regulator with XRE-family HTH domain